MRAAFLLAALLPLSARAQDAPRPGAPDPWPAITDAFAQGKPLPKAEFAPGAERSVYLLMQKVSDGCAAPCKTDAYLKNIALVCRARRLPDAAKVQAVYCPGNPPLCRTKARPGEAVAGDVPATEAGRAGRARAAKAAATGAALAGALSQDKDDDSGAAPAGAADSSAGGEDDGGDGSVAAAPAVPAARASAPPPPPTAAPAPAPDQAAPLPAPSGSLLDRLIDKALPDLKRQFELARAESGGKVASGAAAALGALPGARAKDLAGRFAQAAALADPVERGRAQRALIAEADPVFRELLDKSLAAELAAAREKTCGAKKGGERERCFSAAPSAAEAQAARERVFAKAPALGLYFVARSEHQLFIKDRLAAGALWAGERLEPWELDSSLPEGTKITVAAQADPDAKKDDAPYAGLTFDLPDGSSRFEGRRDGKRGDETLTIARGKDGREVRAVASRDRAETRYLAPGGRLVRDELSSAGGAHVEIKDYNATGAKNELRRYEIRDKKGGRERVEVRDPDSLRNTVTDFDGTTTVTSRVPKGLPVDTKDPNGTRWLEQKGRVDHGRFDLQEVRLADQTVLRGDSKSGRFAVTEIRQPDGRVLTGASDPKTGRFEAASVIEKDGSGRRRVGRVVVALGPGGKALRYTVSLKGQPVSRLNAFAIAGEFCGAAGLPKERVGPLGEWLYDRMLKVPWSGDRDDEGVHDAVLISERPREEVDVVPLVTELETTHLKDEDVDIRTGNSSVKAGRPSVATWETATQYKDEKPGLVLRALDDQGVPQREYAAAGVMRQWFKGWSGDGSGGAGLFTSSKEYQHALLIQFRRDPAKERRWISACADENDGSVDDPKAACEDKWEAGKPVVIHTTASGISDLAGALNDMPVIKQASKYATKGYYSAIGYIQQDIGFDSSSDEDKRLAVIANKYRGAASKASTLEALADDPELLRDVDEKVIERRKTARHDECVRLGDGCDAAMRRGAATDEERLAVVDYAYSPAHAIDTAADGGSKFLYVLGGLGQAGEAAAASLPVMGLTEGLGALSKVKFVGTAAAFGESSLSSYMMRGWVVGGLSNGADMVEGIREGDVARVVKTGVTVAGDALFAYKGRAEGKEKAAEKAKVQEALKAERERLQRLENLPEKGITWVQLDLARASPADLARYRAALKELGIAEVEPVHGVVEIETTPRRRGLLEERLRGSTVESVDLHEASKRQDERAPFTAEEVDEMFAKSAAFNDEVRLDLSDYPPKDYKVLRQAIAELGGTWTDPVDGVAKASLPHGKGAELAKRLEWTPARILKPGEGWAGAGDEGGHAEAEAPGARGPAREIEKLWNHENGAGLTRLETVKAQRKAAFHAALDPALVQALRKAEAAGLIAPASWQGQQGAESNCVPHALANASNGVFTLQETVAAGVAAGADYSKSGTSEPQLLQMMSSLEADAAAKGIEVDYRAVDPGEYFREQEAAAAAGKPRQAAVAIIRTGGTAAEPHALHAVAVRGQIVAGGEHYVVVTDSHMNQPLLYTAEAFSAAVVSDGVVLIDARPARASR